jgi:hypothetical protein
MVLIFDVGDIVIVNGYFEGETYNNTPVVIKKIIFSKSHSKGDHYAYLITYDKKGKPFYWWVVTEYEKTGPTKLKMEKIKKPPIKEEDIEWF